MDPLVALLALVLLAQVATAVVLLLRRRPVVAREVRVIHVADEPPAEGEADYTIRQPVGAPPHDHVWGAQPFAEDATSRSFACLVPRCARVHTEARRGR